MIRRDLYIAPLLIGLLLPCSAPAMTPEETTMITYAAERGSDGAQLLLAVEYLHGDGGMARDDVKAAYWLEQAGAQGNAVAQKMLGDLYQQGRGVPQNLKLSADWRLKAAQRGNPDAQLSLGKMYLAGEGLEQDPKQAEYWLKRAAEEGRSGEAKFLLGRIYQSRSDDRRNRELGGNLLAQSAAHGYESTVAFMNLLEDARYGMSEMYHQHPADLHKLAEDGDADSQYLLATRYESGHGEKLNHTLALYWFRKAAENGQVMAMKSLAHIYAKGLDGAFADPDAAKAWARKAQAAEKH